MDWVTVSALATAGGTLILAIATFMSARSANRPAQRMISRFTLTSMPNGSWLAIVGRHWNLDRADQR